MKKIIGLTINPIDIKQPMRPKQFSSFTIMNIVTKIRSISSTIKLFNPFGLINCITTSMIDIRLNIMKMEIINIASKK